MASLTPAHPHTSEGEDRGPQGEGGGGVEPTTGHSHLLQNPLGIQPMDYDDTASLGLVLPVQDMMIT